VEDPVGNGVDLQVAQAGWWVLLRLAQHVMPLQNLMKDDSVDESTKADSKQYAGAADALALRGFLVQGNLLPGNGRCQRFGRLGRH
jgi:hypothetical protein